MNELAEDFWDDLLDHIVAGNSLQQIRDSVTMDEFSDYGYFDEWLDSNIVTMWGYLYRHFLPPLSKLGRVVVPDHMGFGKSETPQDRAYTMKTHVENLAVLLDELELQDITFVVQDWGGPLAGAYTVRNAGRVKRLCLMNTLLGYGGGDTGVTPWFQWIG